MIRVALLFAFVGLSFARCASDEEAYVHGAEEHPEGHDHHAEDHGHGGTPMERLTVFGDAHELFVEHGPAVAGKELELLVQATVLDGFRPLEGAVRLELEGPAAVPAVTASPTRPGVYTLAFTPPAAGTYRGRVVRVGAEGDVLPALTIRVFADEAAARAAIAEAPHEGLIELLKEQQWAVPFATRFASRGEVIASIEVAGVVTTPPGGSAEVGAPVAGRLDAPPGGFPRPGEPVRRGRVLAVLAPAPSSPEDTARASLGVAEAEARAGAARIALARAERLHADQAISRRELEDAQREVAVAEEAVRAARRASQVFSRSSRGIGRGAYRLVSPIDGVVVEVNASPGASVGIDEVLFRIVDPSELWIRAEVPEQEAARLRPDGDAAYRIAGLDEWIPMVVSGDDAEAALVTIGRTVDRVTRTVEVVYALRRPDPRLRIGGLVQVSLPAGETMLGIVVPRSAVLEDDGRHVVYVQVDGEHFEERTVRVGPRAGDRVAIVEGLAAGERVVTEGAHVVRLADRRRGAEPHGHVH